MKFSQTFIPTLKEAPTEATLKSHILMIRSGMIRKVSSGIYSFLPYGLAVLEKIKKIVQEEMNSQGALEVAMPVLIPKTLLEQSGRWQTFKRELFRLQDRNDSYFALSPTNEENFTQLILEEMNSYRQFPINLYQINHKFRDEIRPRYGIIRSKEFIMKDAYSFHLNEACLDETYKKMSKAYHKIFHRCGLDFVNVKADSGAMGGNKSEEFMVKSDVGEEFIINCQCGYTSNLEAAEEKISYTTSQKLENVIKPVEKVHTPRTKTIEMVKDFLSVPIEKTIKTMAYEMQINKEWKPFIILIRGDYEINSVKLEKWTTSQGADEIRLMEEKQIQNVFGPSAKPGYIGIKNLILSIPIVVDISLQGIQNAVMGANEENYHYIHINLEEELKSYKFYETPIYTAREEGNCLHCNSFLSQFKGIEVGHIFKLGRKYAKNFNLNIAGNESGSIVPTMGCYGIGISRVLAACVEQLSDDRGIILPPSLAPYKVIILTLNPEDIKTMKASEKLYQKCIKNNLSPLWDERKERAGFKFKDADLIGIPLQVVIGKKAMTTMECEVRIRAQEENSKFKIPLSQTLSFLVQQYHKLQNL